MKKSTLQLLLLILFISGSMNIYAQDYEVEFAIIDEGFKPESILVENISQGTSLTLAGTDILHLVEITGVEEVKKPEEVLSLYPNPMNDHVMVEFYHQQAGQVSLRVMDLLGKVIIEKSEFQSEGLLSYQIKNISSGSYMINVVSTGSHSEQSQTLSAICISQSSTNKQARINFVSHQMMNKSAENIEKSVDDIITMQYNEGETIKFTANLVGETAIEEFVVEDHTLIEFYFENLVFDIQDHIYHTKVYGEQRWMTDNLSATMYKDSTEIPTLDSDYDWTTATTPAHVWRNFDEETAREQNLGALYNWFAVETQNICPMGWHVPTDEEFEEFVFYMAANGYNYDGSIYEGNDIDVAGSKIGKALAEKQNWRTPEYGEAWAIGKDMELNNSSGFNGIGADGRYMQTGEFYWDYYLCNWWTSTASETEYSWTYFMYTESTGLFKTYYFKEGGYSVRCIQND